MQLMDTNKANGRPTAPPRPERAAGRGGQRARAVGPAVAALAAAGLLGGCGTAQLASEQPPRQPATRTPAASTPAAAKSAQRHRNASRLGRTVIVVRRELHEHRGIGHRRSRAGRRLARTAEPPHRCRPSSSSTPAMAGWRATGGSWRPATAGTAGPGSTPARPRCTRWTSPTRRTAGPSARTRCCAPPTAGLPGRRRPSRRSTRPARAAHARPSTRSTSYRRASGTPWRGAPPARARRCSAACPARSPAAACCGPPTAARPGSGSAVPRPTRSRSASPARRAATWALPA